MKEGLEGFKQIRREAELFYQTIGAVRCPYFGELILFDRIGLNHLMYKNSSRPRDVRDQARRFHHLAHAVHVLKTSHTVQEYMVRQQWVRVIVNSRWENRLCPVYYFAFCALIDLQIRVKVVVRQVEGGDKHFFSVFPEREQKFLEIDEN